MKTALTIAGSDSSGGAGIQADIKTMCMNGVFAMSAITALTAQNTTGVAGIMEVTPQFLAQQIDCVFTDIRPDAVKIGMVSSSGLIETIAERLRFYGAENIVLDPVMVATSGARLIEPEAVAVLTRALLPLAAVVTPNIPEAEILAQMPVRSEDDMQRAAEVISARYGCAVLCKGGLGVVGLLIIVFSTVTTTFLDAYSAGVSSASVFSRINGKWVALGATVLGTVGAIVYPMDNITDFLYLIGSVFAPMIAIQIADFFILKRDYSERQVNVQNLIIWVIGFALYRLLMRVDIVVGNTLPDMLITALLCIAVHQLHARTKA